MAERQGRQTGPPRRPTKRSSHRGPKSAHQVLGNRISWGCQATTCLSGAPPKVTRRSVAGPGLGGRKAAGEGQSRLVGPFGCRSCKGMSPGGSTGVRGPGQQAPPYTVPSPSTPHAPPPAPRRGPPPMIFSVMPRCAVPAAQGQREPPNSPTRAGGREGDSPWHQLTPAFAGFLASHSDGPVCCLPLRPCPGRSPGLPPMAQF